MSKPGVIYLYRHAEGDAPVRRFLDTYRAHPAGLAHDLHVIFKGFSDRAALDAARALFAGVPHNAIEFDDSGFDIGSYVAASGRVDNRRVLFLNTFSQILGDDWLKLFDNAMNVPGVGIAGATGSWQSNAAAYERAIRRLILAGRNRLPMMPPAEASFNVTLLRRPDDAKPRPLSRYFYAAFHYIYLLYEYGRHPNPHLRTTAFMVDREQFLSLRFPPFDNKKQAYQFESGRLSLTRQYLARGLKPVVVGRDGRTFTIDQWNMSSTFWKNDQSNLLVADNRTCDYSNGTAEMRAYLEHIAWVSPWART